MVKNYFNVYNLLALPTFMLKFFQTYVEDQ